MRCFLLFAFSFIILLLPAQSDTPIDIASPKPSITIDGVNCAIGNTIYTCVPKTCASVTITEGDSIQFCTNNEIYLNTDTAYWLQWNFTGSSNFPLMVVDSFPSNTPVCYYPKWTTAGIYDVHVFYNGWLSAYPTSDCWSSGPSHWIITVDVQINTGITKPVYEVACEIFPNPGNGIFKLQITNPEKVEAITITDIFGKEILTPHDKTKVDLTNFPSGIYLLHISTTNGRIVKKIVKE